MPLHKSILKKTSRYQNGTLPFKRFKTALDTYTDVKTLYVDLEEKINKTDVANVLLDVAEKIKTAEKKSERLQSMHKEKFRQDEQKNHTYSYPILNCTCLLKMFDESRRKLEELCMCFELFKLKLVHYSEELNKDVRSSWNCSESIEEMEEKMSDILTMAQKIWLSNILLEGLNKKL